MPRREAKRTKAARAGRILEDLHALYPDATCALDHGSALELLMATVLSAQCTDVRVNLVTPALFRRYSGASDFARAKPRELEELIHSTGFFRNKAKSIIGIGEAIEGDHGGEVPSEMAALVALPGVGRKTASVVLGTWFGLPALPVDTHVKRLSGRLDLSRETDPNKIERDLAALCSPEEWSFLSHGLILHGRQVCPARRPRCEDCTLRPDCPWPPKG